MTGPDARALLAAAAACVVQEYPHKLDQVLESDADVLPPRVLHPAFFGSYDWHSSVHNHWLLAYGLRRWPDAAQAAGAAHVLDAHLTPEKVRDELSFFQQAQHSAVERPYGWAWLIFLAGELQEDREAPRRRHWEDATAPAAHYFMDRAVEYFEALDQPVVSGSYNDTAFSLSLIIAGGRRLGNAQSVSRLTALAHSWFDSCRLSAAAPTYGDFLPVGLTVADLMATLTAPGGYGDWLTRCFPELGELTASSSDASHLPTDPDGVHHYGLFLSRAWCLYAVAGALEENDPRRETLVAWADQQAAVGRRATVTGNFLADHWLPTFLAYLDSRLS